MDKRELGLEEIFDRVKVKKDDLGVVAFHRTPTNPVNEDNMPCVIMHEGDDYIIKAASRNNHGYPATRLLEVILEVIVKDGDARALTRQIRGVVFSEKNVTPQVINPHLIPGDKTTFIRESHTEGPSGYGLPGLLGMRLVLELIYIDGGL